MAVNDSNVIGIRQELNAKGIDNNRIGFNKQTGYVTIDGQQFLQPGSVTKGTSYADPTAFSDAFNVYDTGSKTKAATDNYLQAASKPYTNPMDEQIKGILDKINGAMNPSVYDVYSDPQYGAYQAQAGRAAHQGIRSAQESMGASGFGRSTNLADRAQHIQNDSNEYLQTQVVPMLQSAHRAEEAQKLSSFMSLLNALSGQQGVYDNRHNNEVDQLGQTLDFLTGRSDRADDTAYRTARDKITDENSKKVFDENVRQFGLNYALQEESNRQSAANASASRRLAESNAERTQSNEDFNRAMTIWQATGKAPSGLESFGVTAGTSYGTPKVDFPREFADMNAALTNGTISADVALNEINSMVKNGEINAAQAQMLINAATPFKAKQLNSVGVKKKKPALDIPALNSLARPGVGGYIPNLLGQ